LTEGFPLPQAAPALGHPEPAWCDEAVDKEAMSQAAPALGHPEPAWCDEAVDRGAIRGPPMPMHPLVLRTRDAANYLGLSESHLEKLRIRGGGPLYVRFSPRAVGYRITDLDAWAASRLRTSTSAPEPGSLPPVPDPPGARQATARKRSSTSAPAASARVSDARRRATTQP
jgi:hypothetical protein